MRSFLSTTLPSNDLGLLTRSLPIATELRKRGHQVIFCSPAKSPSRLVNEAGFENLLPGHPLYHLIATELNFRGHYRSITSAQFKRNFGNLFNFSSQLIRTVNQKSNNMQFIQTYFELEMITVFHEKVSRPSLGRFFNFGGCVL